MIQNPCLMTGGFFCRTDLMVFPCSPVGTYRILRKIKEYYKTNTIREVLGYKAAKWLTFSSETVKIIMDKWRAYETNSTPDKKRITLHSAEIYDTSERSA